MNEEFKYAILYDDGDVCYEYCADKKPVAIEFHGYFIGLDFHEEEVSFEMARQIAGSKFIASINNTLLPASVVYEFMGEYAYINEVLSAFNLALKDRYWGLYSRGPNDMKQETAVNGPKPCVWHTGNEIESTVGQDMLSSDKTAYVLCGISSRVFYQLSPAVK